MTDTRSDIVSVVERTRLVAARCAVVAVHFLGRTSVFVLSEEALVLAEPDGEMRRRATRFDIMRPVRERRFGPCERH